VRGLRDAVVGRTIAAAQVLLPAAVRFPPVPQFLAQLENCVVDTAERRGKFILLGLAGELLLGLHMMLWGTLRLVPAGQRLPYTLIAWQLSGGEDLLLMDKLGYARAALGPPAALAEGLGLHRLGPDALDPAFDAAALARAI